VKNKMFDLFGFRNKEVLENKRREKSKVHVEDNGLPKVKSDVRPPSMLRI
jgi:hypothetical protein